ncbi:MAG TPA: methylmalonyl-CoA epimerase [Chloroflexota bacterium]|nr:methylmalonyl-CoA epimerase [Chloroflexota bacterium]
MLALTGLDHIGIATASLADSLHLYQQVLGMTPVHHEVLENQGVEVVLLACGGQQVELLAPLRADSPVGKFLAERGPGMHHVAYRVPDLVATLAECREAGLELVDQTPRRGAGGHRVAFLHPRSTGRVLIELIEVVEE